LLFRLLKTLEELAICSSICTPGACYRVFGSDQYRGCARRIREKDLDLFFGFFQQFFSCFFSFDVFLLFFVLFAFLALTLDELIYTTF